MKSDNIPFKFDLSEGLNGMRRAAKKHVGDVRLNLPFLSVGISPKDREKVVAREIVIRLQDRRVLSSWECCDNCIDQALASLQEIRRFLVDKQVELSDLEDGPLYALVELMIMSIRQFLTFEQRLKGIEELPPGTSSPDFRRQPETRQEYFDGLEVLRAHLSRCLGQVSVFAGMEPPTGNVISSYRGEWQIEAYEQPKLPDS